MCSSMFQAKNLENKKSKFSAYAAYLYCFFNERDQQPSDANYERRTKKGELLMFEKSFFFNELYMTRMMFTNLNLGSVAFR